MVYQLTPRQIRQVRLRAQGLDGESSHAEVAQVIKESCGLQSQELPSATLAVRARTIGLVADDVQHAREVVRSIVLTWTMRGTMHLVAAEDVAWQLALFGEFFIRKAGHRYRQLGLDENTRRKASRHIQEILGSRGSLNRAQLAEALAAYGIPVEGQAIHHLVRAAALEGLICFGPEHNGELTYVLLADWLGSENLVPAPDAQSLATLARRYLQAYALAAPHDLASWSGLPLGQAKAGFKAIADELVEVEAGAESVWMLKDQWGHIEATAPEPAVRLLPRYDNYLLGYQSRAFMVEADFARHVHPGGGLIRTSVIVDGEARATWKAARKRAVTEIIVQPFVTLDTAIMPHLEAETQDIGRFLKQDTRLIIENG